MRMSMKRGFFLFVTIATLVLTGCGSDGNPLIMADGSPDTGGGMGPISPTPPASPTPQDFTTAILGSDDPMTPSPTDSDARPGKSGEAVTLLNGELYIVKIGNDHLDHDDGDETVSPGEEFENMGPAPVNSVATWANFAGHRYERTKGGTMDSVTIYNNRQIVNSQFDDDYLMFG